MWSELCEAMEEADGMEEILITVFTGVFLRIIIQSHVLQELVNITQAATTSIPRKWLECEF